MTNKWSVTVEETPNGDFILLLPDDMLSHLGWTEGTELWWTDEHNGAFSLTTRDPGMPVTEVAIDTDAGC